MKHNSFGNNFKILRKKHGWTQVELAHKLKCTQGMITAYENGKKFPNMQNLKLIADVFEVTVDELISSVRNEAEDRDYRIDARILKRAKAIEELSPNERSIIYKMIDSFRAKRKK